MTRAEILTEVAALLSMHLDVPIADIDEDRELGASGLGMDSLDIVEVQVELEEKFGYVLPDDDFDKARTVGELVDLVAQRRAGAA
jgi:acyl carrier protein